MYKSNPDIDECEKCKTLYPTIIHTCSECHKQIAKSRGYFAEYPSRNLCHECVRDMTEKAWQYDQLNK